MLLIAFMFKDRRNYPMALSLILLDFWPALEKVSFCAKKKELKHLLMPKRASFGSTTNPGKLHPETFNTSHFPLSLHPISLPSVLCSPLFPLISPLVIPGLCDCGVSLQSWQIVLFFFHLPSSSPVLFLALHI